jgi:signal transduction histidine kinase
MTNGVFQSHELVAECRQLFTAAEDATGTLWLGTLAGLCRYDPVTGRSEAVHVPGRTIARVDTIHVGADGRLWLGSSDGQPPLSMFDPRTGDYRAFAQAVTAGVWDIASGGDGSLWLATGSGLSRFDPASGTSQPIPSAGPGSVHYSVARDESGIIWSGTNKGLTRFDPATGSGQHYGLEDGIGNLEFNRHAVWKGTAGTLYFGGMHGVTWFAPGALGRSPDVPPVVVTAVRVLGRDGERVIRSPSGPVSIHPGDTAVTFEFAAVTFTQAHRSRYRYRLSDVDAGWVEAGTSRSARYTNLPPGRHVLHVTASNSDGVWNEVGVVLPVVVVPAATQTWWFRALLVIAALGGLTVAYRLRVRRLLEIERLRLRIAGDLHDELGSDMSGLAIASNLVGRSDRLTDRDRDRLASMSATATRALESLRDVVWHINPEHDTLPSLDARLRSVAATLLADVPYEIRTSGLGAGAMPMDVRRHVLLIYKELLHNVVRHARATRVRIAVSFADGRLRLVVEDDGVGMAGDGSRDGTGLRSVRRRAAAIGAALDIGSPDGRGTRTELVVPLTRTRRGRRRSPRVR